MVRPEPGPSSEPHSGHRGAAPALARPPAAGCSSQMRRLHRGPEWGERQAAGLQAGAGPRKAWAWGSWDQTPFGAQVWGRGFAFSSLEGSGGIGDISAQCQNASFRD